MRDLLRRWCRPERPVERFLLVDESPRVPAEAASERPVMRRVVAEALILQDEAEDVIRGVRAREGLGHLAPRGGPLVRRFFGLRDSLPLRCALHDEERLRAELDGILHYHALALTVALDLLACEWRSPKLTRQIDALHGLGEPARRLEEIYSELASPSR